MTFAAKLNSSWELMQSSLRVIRANPRLALFPVVSSFCAILLAAFFFLPIVVVVVGNTGVQTWLAGRHWDGKEIEALQRTLGWTFYSYSAVIYLVSLFVGTFFNVAFYHEIMRALAGGNVSLAGGLRFATTRWRSILMWSLLAGTIGLVIRSIEERLGWFGRYVMAAIGTVWSVAAVFAIPVIIRREESNPLAVLRDSAVTLKKTWGESLVGFVGIQLASLAVVVVALLAMFVVLVVSVPFKLGLFMLLGFATIILGLFIAGFLINLATNVYRCALYVYASEGVVPDPFTVEMLNAGWKVKKV